MKQSAWQGPIRGSNPCRRRQQDDDHPDDHPGPRPLSGVFRPLPDYTHLGWTRAGAGVRVARISWAWGAWPGSGQQVAGQGAGHGGGAAGHVEFGEDVLDVVLGDVAG